MLYLPRPGRARRTAGWGTRGHDHGAVAGRVAAGERPHRFRDQDAAARNDRTSRGEDLPGGRDDAARRQRRSVDRGHRVLLRNSFGNRASFVSAADVARVRASTAARKALWTPEELEASVPRVMVAQPTWKVTASHNAQAAGGALTFTTWNTSAPQQPGMWFQVELPEAARVTEIQFESPGGRGGGGGGRGRANAPVAGPGGAPGAAPVAGGAPPAANAQNQAAAEAPARRYSNSRRRCIRAATRSKSRWTVRAGRPSPRPWPGGASGRPDDNHPLRAGAGQVREDTTATAEPPVNWSIQRLRLYEVGERQVGVN